MSWLQLYLIDDSRQDEGNVWFFKEAGALTVIKAAGPSSLEMEEAGRGQDGQRRVAVLAEVRSPMFIINSDLFSLPIRKDRNHISYVNCYPEPANSGPLSGSLCYTLKGNYNLFCFPRRQQGNNRDQLGGCYDPYSPISYTQLLGSVAQSQNAVQHFWKGCHGIRPE